MKKILNTLTKGLLWLAVIAGISKIPEMIAYLCVQVGFNPIDQLSPFLGAAAFMGIIYVTGKMVER